MSFVKRSPIRIVPSMLCSLEQPGKMQITGRGQPVAQEVFWGHVARLQRLAGYLMRACVRINEFSRNLWLKANPAFG